jgi:hypothetical protein
MAHQTSMQLATPMTLEQIKRLTDQVFLAAFNAPSGMRPEGVVMYRHTEGAAAAIDMLGRMERALIRGLNVQEADAHPNLADVQATVPQLESRLAATYVALDCMQDQSDIDDAMSPEVARLLERKETLEWVLESLKVSAPASVNTYRAEALPA